MAELALRQRRIGTADIVFFVVAASAPLTVVAGGTPVAFAVSGVLGIPAIYLILAAVLAVFTGGYAAMSRRIVGAGAFYAYVSQGLGRVAGLGAAFVALVSYNSMQIGIYGLFSFTVAQFLGFDNWWVIALVAIAGVGVLGYLRVDLNARVLAVLLIVESLTVLVFDIGAFTSAPEGISATPFTWAAITTGAVGAAFSFVMAGFMGFESGALYSEECRDPRTTVARATYIAVGVIGVFYALSAWAMFVGAGESKIVAESQKNGPALLFVLGEGRFGAWFSDVANVFLITSLFAALLSFHNAIARYLFALGRERVLPPALGQVHPRTGSPYRGSLVQTVTAVVVVSVFGLAGKDPVATLFTWLTNLGAIGVILLLAVTSASVVGFFASRREEESAWNSRIAPVLAALSLGAVFVVALVNFDALLGAEKGSPLVWILPAVVIGAAVVGVLFGLFLRTAKPDVYRRIGHGEAA
ncbi:APC family permease [Nonomuraea sp. NPDC050556]|uniref:APC family permease n=1 Tax=Nonomuraea sp. NPDC050556 TaxID=3364369 RepID=UPI0037BADFB7